MLTVQHMLHMQGCFTEAGRILLWQVELLDLEAGPVLCEGKGIEHHQCRLHAGVQGAGCNCRDLSDSFGVSRSAEEAVDSYYCQIAVLTQLSQPCLVRQGHMLKVLTCKTLGKVIQSQGHHILRRSSQSSSSSLRVNRGTLCVGERTLLTAWCIGAQTMPSTHISLPAAFASMPSAKIKVQNPVVDLDGDEMTR